MIKSMTGFGKGEASVRNRKFTVEVRSLNSKQLDLSVRIPAAYRSAEYELRTLAARRLGRGKAELSVSVELSGSESRTYINKEAFAACYAQYAEACASVPGLAETDAVRAMLVQTALRQPEVVGSGDETASEEEFAALIRAAEEALEQLDRFRVQEGATLIADLLKRVELIERLKDEVEPYEKTRIAIIRARILDQLAKLPVEADMNRLEQEMIFYLEKLDITEEKVRLTNHCRYFREVAAGEEAAGRKLGFIAQEMGREINTLGSKANESEIQVLVVRMKDELEKIKEQVLNLL